MALEMSLRVVAYCDRCGEDEDAAKFGPVTSFDAGRAALTGQGWQFGSDGSALCWECTDLLASG
jgi:hypothetical protein